MAKSDDLVINFRVAPGGMTGSSFFFGRYNTFLKPTVFAHEKDIIGS